MITNQIEMERAIVRARTEDSHEPLPFRVATTGIRGLVIDYDRASSGVKLGYDLRSEENGPAYAPRWMRIA